MEEERIISLTPKQVGVIITTALAILGWNVADLVAPIRHDPYTGTEGRKLERRIEKLERDLELFKNECRDTADHYRIQIDNNRELITDCLRRTK